MRSLSQPLVVAEPGKVTTAPEMDKTTPQERADAVEAAVRRSWDEVDLDFRDSTADFGPDRVTETPAEPFIIHKLGVR